MALMPDRSSKRPRDLNQLCHIDDVGFAYGQAEVSLNVISTTTPPSSPLETRLALLLVARARAAIG